VSQNSHTKKDCLLSEITPPSYRSRGPAQEGSIDRFRTVLSFRGCAETFAGLPCF
jgi:hypothetical protein